MQCYNIHLRQPPIGTTMLCAQECPPAIKLTCPFFQLKNSNSTDRMTVMDKQPHVSKLWFE